MEKTKQKVQFIWIDAMKGILILLMVIGHSYVQYKNFIYLFHMSVFFMVSGYCWNDRHSESFSSIKDFCLKRIIRLYIPFVGINLGYILLTNLFIKTGIYSNSPDFLSTVGNTPVQQHLVNYMSIASMGKAIVRTLCFAGGAAQLSGATWFLTSLFFASVLHCVLVGLLKRIKLDNVIVYSLILLSCLILAFFAERGLLSNLGVVNRFPATYSAYLGGVLVRLYNMKYGLHIKDDNTVAWLIAFLISFLGLVLFVFSGFHIELAYSEISNPFFYFVCSLLGWIFIKSLSILICKNNTIATCLRYLGKRTIPILLFHTLSFKIVSLFYIIIKEDSFLFLASYPIVFSSPELLRYVYVAVGIAVPLLIYKVYSLVKRSIISIRKS